MAKRNKGIIFTSLAVVLSGLALSAYGRSAIQEVTKDAATSAPTLSDEEFAKRAWASFYQVGPYAYSKFASLGTSFITLLNSLPSWNSISSKFGAGDTV